jgi:hypothetical protein
MQEVRENHVILIIYIFMYSLCIRSKAIFESKRNQLILTLLCQIFANLVLSLNMDISEFGMRLHAYHINSTCIYIILLPK